MVYELNGFQKAIEYKCCFGGIQSVCDFNNSVTGPSHSALSQVCITPWLVIAYKNLPSFLHTAPELFIFF